MPRLSYRLFKYMFAAVPAAAVTTLASAQSAPPSSVFENVASDGQTPPETLKLQPDHRYFIRGGVAHLKFNSKTSGTYDVTGPVVDASRVYSEVSVPRPEYGYVVPPAYSSQPIFNSFVVDTALGGAGTVLGTPPNATAEAEASTGWFVSIGQFLDVEHKWAVEGLLLAAPFSNTAKGTGVLQKLGTVIETKFLPPLVMGQYHFGQKNDRFRVSVGAGLTYSIFFESKATAALQEYVGGPTDVKLANKFGAGLFLGGNYKLDDRWHVNAMVGYIKTKTTATLTTRNTRFTVDSAVLRDFNNAGLESSLSADITRGTVTDLLNNLSVVRGGSLGTYVRKMDLDLDPYVFLVSVGYSF